MIPGNIFEEQRVFNIEATAIDSTSCSKYIIAAGYHRAYIINTNVTDVPTEIKIRNKLVTFLLCHPKLTQNVAIVSGSDVGLYSLDTMKQHVRCKNANGSSRYIADVSWSYFESNLIATCSPYDSTLLRDIRNVRRVSIEVGAQSGATQAKFSPLLDYILATSSHNQSILWDIRYPKRAMTMLECHSSPITCLKWHPTQKHSFFTCSKDNLFRCWDFFNEDGAFTESVDFSERDLEAWRFWFSQDGSEYAIIKSPILQKIDGGMEVYQYPFQENLNPLKIDNSDLFIDLCWSKNHNNKPSKYLWALRQSKGLIRHSIIFDYSSENREEMATPIAQSAMDEESDRLITNQKYGIDSESSSEFGSPDIDKGGLMIGEMDIDKKDDRFPFSSTKSSSYLSSIVAQELLSRHSNSTTLQGHIPTSPIINDYERWITAPGNTGDLYDEMDALWKIESKGVTMTEINIPRAALGFTYEHFPNVKKLGFEMRFHKTFFENGKIIVKLIEKDCPFNGEQAKNLLMLMQKEADYQMKLNSTTPVFARVVSEMRKLVTSMNVYPIEEYDSDEYKRSICSNHDNASEESERHSVSLSIITSDQDRLVPAPRTSGAQFDSSGYLVRFGNFRSKQRIDVQRSDSKLSATSIDYKQLGIIDVDTESENVSNKIESSDEEKNGDLCNMFKTAEDCEESDENEINQRIRINRRRRLRMRGLISNSESKLTSEELQYLSKLEELSSDETDSEEDENYGWCKSKNVNKNQSSSSSSIFTEKDDVDEKTNDLYNCKNRKEKKLSDPFLSSDSESELFFPENKFGMNDEYTLNSDLTKNKKNISDIDSITDDSISSSSTIGFKNKILKHKKNNCVNPTSKANSNYKQNDDNQQNVENVNNTFYYNKMISLNENDKSDNDDNSDILEEDEDPCLLDTIEDEYPIKHKKLPSLFTDEITSIININEYCKENRKKLGFLTDEFYNCPNKFSTSKMKSFLNFNQDTFESSTTSTESEYLSSETDSDLEYYKNSKKPTSSVLMNAHISSLFPFGDKRTTPRSFSDYLTMMEPLLKDIAEMKKNIGYTDEHNIIGSSFSPELLPKGDVLPFLGISPIRNYSLSSSPTPAAILLHRNNPSGRLGSPPNSMRNYSSRHRCGSLTFIDSESNIKGSSSDALVSTPVEIFDVSYYLPVDKKMARNYRFIGNNYKSKVKRHNKLAKKESRPDVSNTWEICNHYIKSCFEKKLFKNPKRCNENLCPTDYWDVNNKYDLNEEIQTRRKTIELIMNAKNNDKLPLPPNSINIQFFSNILQNHIEIGDVQTIAAVTCTLNEPCILPPKSSHRRTSLIPITFSKFPEKSIATKSTINVNALPGNPLTVMLPLNGNKIERSASIGASPESLLENNKIHAKLMTDDLNDLLKKSSAKKQQKNQNIEDFDISPATNFDSIIRKIQFQNISSSEDITSAGNYLNNLDTPLIFDYNSDEECSIQVIDDKNNTFENSNENIDIFEQYRVKYADILARWGYFKKSAEVLKFCPTQQPYPFTDIIVCEECQNVLENEDMEFCRKCGTTALTCSICDMSVYGLFVSCPHCSHGGHVEHIISWFKEQTLCPFGCGCTCPF